MNRRARYILVTILIVVSIGAISGYRMWNKEPDKVEDIEGVPVAASDFIKEFSADETKAHQKYLNKAVEVTGIVSGMEQNQDGGNMLIIQGDDPMMSVQCAMRDAGVKVENGKTVTIKGFYSASSMLGISLTDCVIK
jgi:predicted RNA-binding protein with PUA domain